MARPTEFDRKKVLQESIYLFWRFGYHNTSIAKLGEHMQLHPGSLYSAFKNKHQLFLEALELYFEQSSKSLYEQLHSDDSSLVGIQNFFAHLINLIVDKDAIGGCFMINTASEITNGVEDELVRKRLAQMFESHEKQFRAALERAQKDGELHKNKNPNALARYLMMGVRGLRVYSQTRAQRSDLEGLVNNLLVALD